MKQPLVSISCITYNQVNYIKDCLDGFLMQKVNFDYEIIIHDDASTDGTKDIIEDYIDKFPNLIYPIFRDTNQYSQGTRHIMARFNFPRCRGKYIAWCDGDDYWTDPYKLQKQVDFLEANPDFTICFHNADMVDKDKNYCWPYIPYLKENREISIIELIEKNIIPTASCVFRNPFRNTPSWIFTLPIGDWGLHLNNANQGKVFYLHETMSAYRYQPNSIWSSLDFKTKKHKEIDTIKKISEAFYPNYQDYFQKSINQRDTDLKKWKIEQRKKIIDSILEKIKKPLRPIKRIFFRR
jgi:glycosyltransferase involved in cell wall biosynthesis